MASLRLTLVAPAVWLSGRLNFALKYWALGLGIAVVGAYLSTPLFEQINREIAMAKTQLDGVKLVAQQNQIFLQMVALRGELTAHDTASSVDQLSSITASIDDMLLPGRIQRFPYLHKNQQPLPNILLGRARKRATSSSLPIGAKYISVFRT